jgi:hypothetical protein
MRKSLLFILLIFQFAQALPQGISVKSSRLLENDLTARTESVLDQNGDKCALIKVVTTEKGFSWDVGIAGVVKTVRKTGEYWLYVPWGVKAITISHDKLGVLRNYPFNIPIEKARVYELVLTTDKVKTVVEKREIPTQWVLISSEPSDADVYIDDQYKGQTPWQGELEEGEYSYRIEKNLYYPDAGKINPKADGEKVDLNIQLKENYGSIFVKSIPEDNSDIFINGQNIGEKTPTRIDNLKSDMYEIELRNKWYKPLKRQIQVKDGEEHEIDVQLEPIFGEVNVESDNETTIYIDGEFAGRGRWNGRLVSGIHSFVAKKEKFDSDSIKIKVELGRTHDINLRPKPKCGILKVVTVPFKAKVFLNDQEYGSTPITINDLLIGTYNLKVIKSGYQDMIQKIDIEEGKICEFDEKLIKGNKTIITSTPSGARVYISDEYIGNTPIQPILSDGEYDLKLIYKSSQVINKAIKVDGKRNNEWDFEFKESKSISFSSSPYSSQVFIDGQYIGLSPITKELFFGKYRVEFKNENGRKMFMINVDENSQSQVYVSMAKKKKKSYSIPKFNDPNPIFNNEKIIGTISPKVILAETVNIGCLSSFVINRFIGKRDGRFYFEWFFGESNGNLIFENESFLFLRVNLGVEKIILAHKKISLGLLVGFGGEGTSFYDDDADYSIDEGAGIMGLHVISGLGFNYKLSSRVAIHSSIEYYTNISTSIDNSLYSNYKYTDIFSNRMGLNYSISFSFLFKKSNMDKAFNTW